MNRERAQYILNNKKPFGELKYAFRFGFESSRAPVYQDGITEEEHAFIKSIWETMPGYTSYMDALCRIAYGAPLPLGITCGDCKSLGRCAALVGIKKESNRCFSTVSEFEAR